MPPPATITSAPPPPSIVSAPAPVVIVFAELVPVIDTAPTPEASTFSKFDTFTVSPLVWSASVRFTVTAVFRISVSVAVPPSIEVSDP